jgi:REP element-mobilizing transposase RayT
LKEISSTYVGALHELPLRIQRRSMTLGKMIGRFKMNSSKRINDLRNTPGIPVWQRNYYEHVIRNEKELYEIIKNIENNPLDWFNDKYYITK